MNEPRIPLSSPPDLAEAAIDARARCDALGFALKAYVGLEKLLAEARGGDASVWPIERGEIAALIALINEEASRRVADAHEAVEVLREAGKLPVDAA